MTFENGDAGQTLDTAQNILSGTATLNSISGRISSVTDADLFRFFIQEPAAFSATTVGGTVSDSDNPLVASFDTQLFLFDANGFGVEENDDDFSNGTAESTLPAGNPFSPTSPGIYLLGISSFNNDSLSAGGVIFDDPSPKVLGPRGPIVGGRPQFTQQPARAVGPTGPGGGAPLTNFNGDGNDIGSNTGSYEISLTGATAVPEPSSILGLLTFGVIGAGAMLKRKWKSYKN